MRLTLRTMLAYQDDLLEANDAEELRAKIEDSEFATNLIQRTQDVMRQLRLSAPKPVGKGMGRDPNTVAEYLDNTMASERVADFERVCLESSVHLAEVSACHQILALVLGEQADVDPEARRAMYTLPSRLEARARATADAKAAIAAELDHDADHDEEEDDDLPRATTRRAPPEVPDYLREPDRWPKLVPIVAASLLLMLLAAAIWMAADPMNWLGPVAQQDQADVAVVPVDNNVPAPIDAPKNTPDAIPTTALPDSTATPSDTSAVANSPAAAALVTVPETAGPDQLPATVPDAVNQEPLVPAATSSAVVDAGTPTVPPVDATAANTIPTPPVDATAVPATDAAAVGGLGRLISNNSVLLKLDPSDSTWRRMPAGDMVNPGDRLLALPTFRSTVTLNTGVTVDVIGPALVEFQAVDEQGAPTIALDYGRLTLLNLGHPNTRAKLRLLGREGVVTFTNAESSIAVEVLPILPPGQNPETGPAPRLIDLYAISGQSTWQEAGVPETRTVQAPAHWRPGQPAVDAGAKVTLPTWIALDDTAAIDRRASQHIGEYLKASDNVRQGLMEVSAHRLKEYRSVAARCLAQIDEFEPAVDTLNDLQQSAFGSWSSVIRSLRSALARDPETAKKVRAAFEKRRGESGVALSRMLWGYTPDQLRDGSAAMLVEYLDHPDLDFRVLSLANLQEIVGSSLRYRPEQDAAARRPYVQQWQRKLEDGAIMPKPTG